MVVTLGVATVSVSARAQQKLFLAGYAASRSIIRFNRLDFKSVSRTNFNLYYFGFRRATQQSTSGRTHWCGCANRIGA